MKSNLKQSIALCLTLALFLSSLLSVLHINMGTAEAAVTLPDNEYSVSYRYLKDNTIDSSAANGYLSVLNSGKLIVKDGKMKFEHQITQKYYSYFQHLSFRKAGAVKAVIDSSTQAVQGIEGYQSYPVRPSMDGTGNWIATIDVEDITKKPDVLMHVVIKNDPHYPAGFVYDYWYNVQLEINTSSLPLEGGGGDGGTEQPITIGQLNTLITDSRKLYADTSEGTNLGDAPAGSKQPFNAKILSAESFIASGNTSAAAIKAAYNELLAALNTYKSLIVSANKTNLNSLIIAVSAYLEKMNEIGFTEGKLGYTYAPVTPGEYYKGSKTFLQENVDQAKEILNKVKATQTEVDQAIYNLASDYNYYKVDYYVASKPFKLIVLDSLNRTSIPSQQAPEIADTTVLITNNGKGILDNTRANITFNGEKPPQEMVQSSLVRSTGGFTTAGLSYTNEGNQAVLLTKSSDQQKKVYQVIIRGVNYSDATWQGLSYIRYKLDSVTKEVYLSYNAEQLDALSLAASAAQKLQDEAPVTPGAETAYTAAKTALQSKITAAKDTAQNLAATRPQITAAKTALDQALAAFKTTVTYPLHFSTVHATSDAFSTLDSYFLKPATISTVGSVTYSTYVTAALKDSSTIKEFKVKTGNQYVDSTVVSENTTANTRVIKFKVDSLSALIDAQVRVVIPAQSYDRTHDIRLNFNNVDNSALAQLVTDATNANRAAVTGTLPGQYPEAAKTALQTAITAAGTEASRLTGTAAQSAAALQALQQAFNTFKASVIVGNPDPGIPDSENPISFVIYKKGSNEHSVMYTYVDPTSGKLTVTGGKKYISFTLLQGEEIKSFKTEKNGVLTETETVSSNAAANTRVVRFEIADINARLNGWVKIYWVLPAPIGVYDHEYDVELGFSTQLPAGNKTLLTSEIEAAKAKLTAAVEGSIAGQYKVGAKALLEAAINQAASVSSSTTATQLVIDAAVTALKKSVSIFLASVILADASYTFNWPSTIKDGTGTPLTNFISSNASMKVGSGKQIVTINLVNGVTFKKLQLKKADGSLEDASTIAAAKQAGIVKALATDSATTSVSFEVKDRSAVYVLSLLDAAQTERTFEIDFPGISLTPVTDTGTGTTPTTPTTGSGGGRGGGGGGGGVATVVPTLAETLKAGTYTIDYALYLRSTSQTSSANEFVKHPAKLEIKDGKSYVVLTVASKEVTGLKIASSTGTWKDAEVLSVNESLNEKTLRFEIQNAASKVYAQFKLLVPDKYNGEYEADFSFNQDSIQSIEIPGQQPGTAAGLSFSDLHNHWAQANIERAVALGVVNGYEDGTFRPDANINRAEFATLLNKALKLEPSSNALSFTDLNSIPQWVKPYLAPVVQAGIISGYEDGTFRAERKISRAELAVIIVRALKLNVDTNTQSTFSDADSIPQWAKAAVAEAHKQGIISGRDNNLFAPNESATRAEAVSLVMALQNAILK
ncbi:NEAT domain-containing protein [Paenibacillus radicis (ex Xue et al. 2023)]|uniref:NEAT domain-containing protein n=1 Tax=Paenibacillus radicis (ex Xue et al. 2023) TaxID=2972489 RepID=A0ABT1YQG7_9BACL|nr:NEAT domain-containing protein [Paenibacillus radicis (ex Xue et al. 2023)]MCR8635425.1 NEAT domain-containing protein [Paenibacillus radicis (ex Xue et al. 2023)]